jgi:hypothetical protein
MKKILMVVALFGFGMMVGCGEEPAKKPTTGSSAKPAAGAPADTAKAPADTAKKP